MLDSAINDLTNAVYDTLKTDKTRTELRPLLQDVVSEAEALEILQAYVTNILPFNRQINMVNDILTAVLRWIQWESMLYQLVELYEIKEPWAIAMLV